MKFCFKGSPNSMLKVLMIFQKTMRYGKSVSLAGRFVMNSIGVKGNRQSGDSENLLSLLIMDHRSPRLPLRQTGMRDHDLDMIIGVYLPALYNFANCEKIPLLVLKIYLKVYL